jgi:hypothetical protein
LDDPTSDADLRVLPGNHFDAETCRSLRETYDG